MEIRQLRYFIAVAEEGSFSIAAKRLNISQPPITRQIQKLEEEVGAMLLERTPRGAVLTEAGREFLEDAYQVVAKLQRALVKTQAIQAGSRGLLNIGYFGTVSYYFLPNFLRSFTANSEGVRIKLRRMNKEEQVEALLDGRIEIGFCRHYPSLRGVQIEEVYAEPFALCVPDGFALDVDIANWKDVVSSMPLILFPDTGRPNFADETLSLLGKNGLSVKVDHIVEDARSALMQVALGSGLAITPLSVTRMAWFGVRAIPLDFLQARTPINIIYRDGSANPLLTRFIRALRQRAAFPHLS